MPESKTAAARVVDVVYTWVDDSFPGYLDILRQYSKTGHDRNPNRTRDNIEVMKYSLRSLAVYAPFVRNIYIVSMRPQVPRWLVQKPGLRVIHHDELLDASVLPTFNSFAIVSSISRIPGLSDKFFYIEDDMMFGRPVTLSDFGDEQGRMRLFPHVGATYGAQHRDRDDFSPWNTALAFGNHLLDQAFGHARRRPVNHVPLWLDRGWWDEMLVRWSTEVEATRNSRFRAKYNFVPEYVYLYYLYHTGRARMESMARSYADIGYCPVGNFLPLMRARLARLKWQRPMALTFNDSFGATPNPKVVAAMRSFLETAYPVKSPFEI
jgi:hypothetical protein